MVRQTEIPTFLDSWFTNTRSVNISCPQKIAYAYIFIKHNVHKRLSIEDWSCFLLSPVKLYISC